MGDLSTYSLTDFIPLTPEVYFRLFVRLNDYAWPAHILAVALGFGALWALSRGRGRLFSAALAACWIWVGYAFHLSLYAELNWAATYFGWAFIIQGGLLLSSGFTGRFDPPGGAPTKGPGRYGLAVALLALVAFPIVGIVDGQNWRGIQVFGVAPDPTALFTLGALLIAERTPWHLLAIPILWAVVTGATAWTLGAPGGITTAGVTVVSLGVAIWKVFR